MAVILRRILGSWWLCGVMVLYACGVAGCGSNSDISASENGVHASDLQTREGSVAVGDQWVPTIAGAMWVYVTQYEPSFNFDYHYQVCILVDASQLKKLVRMLHEGYQGSLANLSDDLRMNVVDPCLVAVKGNAHYPDQKNDVLDDNVLRPKVGSLVLHVAQIEEENGKLTVGALPDDVLLEAARELARGDATTRIRVELQSRPRSPLWFQGDLSITEDTDKKEINHDGVVLDRIGSGTPKKGRLAVFSRGRGLVGIYDDESVASEHFTGKRPQIHMRCVTFPGRARVRQLVYYRIPSGHDSVSETIWSAWLTKDDDSRLHLLSRKH